jgi:hypothetical protein
MQDEVQNPRYPESDDLHNQQSKPRQSIPILKTCCGCDEQMKMIGHQNKPMQQIPLWPVPI